jgi:MFS family permease
VLGAAVLLGVGYGCCLIAGLRWIEATTPAVNRGRVTGIFYVVTYLGFWAPTGMAALATAGWIGDRATLWMAAGLALVTAGMTAARRWRSDDGDGAK